MDDAEIGFYIRCLNHSWVNGGIPADPIERSRQLHTRKDTADRRWARVGKCFQTSELDPTLLVNPRQELERKLASQISQVRSESAKRSSKCSANAPLRAYVSVSDSAFDSEKVLPRKENLDRARVKSPAPERFTEWLRAWPRVGSPDAAAQAWISVVISPDDESAAFAARDRYLASDEVARNVIQEPAKWIYDQARGGWGGRWPKASSNGHDTDEALIGRVRALQEMEERATASRRKIS